MEKMVQRSDIKTFYGVGGLTDPTFTRMRGFTDLSASKNPIEYSRKYVDQNQETTSVIGFSPSVAFTLDRINDNPVHEDIVALFDNETIGTDAERFLIRVDFSKPNEEGDMYPAIKRKYAVVGDSEGNGTEGYQYSGNFKTAGTAIKGYASILTPEGGTSEDVETIEFIEE